MKANAKHPNADRLNKWIIERFVENQLPTPHREPSITLERPAQRAGVRAKKLETREDHPLSLPAILLSQHSTHNKVAPKQSLKAITKGTFQYA